MEKPLVISISEFNNKIATIINEYRKEIPSIVMLNSIKDIEKILEARTEMEYEQAVKDYQEVEEDG